MGVLCKKVRGGEDRGGETDDEDTGEISRNHKKSLYDTFYVFSPQN